MKMKAFIVLGECLVNTWKIQNLWASVITRNVVSRHLERKWDLQIRFKSKVVNIIKEHPLYKIEELISQVGGSCGLFLGMSILSVVEIIFHAVISFIQFCIWVCVLQKTLIGKIALYMWWKFYWHFFVINNLKSVDHMLQNLIVWSVTITIIVSQRLKYSCKDIMDRKPKINKEINNILQYPVFNYHKKSCVKFDSYLHLNQYFDWFNQNFNYEKCSIFLH